MRRALRALATVVAVVLVVTRSASRTIGSLSEQLLLVALAGASVQTGSGVPAGSLSTTAFPVVGAVTVAVLRRVPLALPDTTAVAVKTTSACAGTSTSSVSVVPL